MFNLTYQNVATYSLVQTTSLEPDIWKLTKPMIIKKNWFLRRNIITRTKQICAYADDIWITATTKQALKEIFNALKEETENYVYW